MQVQTGPQGPASGLVSTWRPPANVRMEDGEYYPPPRPHWLHKGHSRRGIGPAPKRKAPQGGASLRHCYRFGGAVRARAYGPPKIEPKRQLMPTFTVWRSGKLWLKQKRPPGTTAPDASVAVPQLVTSWSPSAMNMYSALMLQLGAKAHSTPPPTVPTVAVSSLLNVAI